MSRAARLDGRGRSCRSAAMAPRKRALRRAASAASASSSVCAPSRARPDEAPAQRRAPVRARLEVEGGAAAHRAPPAARPAHGDLARRPRAQRPPARSSNRWAAASSASMPCEPRLDARPGRARAARRRRSGRSPRGATASSPRTRMPSLVPAHVARVARDGHAVERALRAVEPARHAQACRRSRRTVPRNWPWPSRPRSLASTWRSRMARSTLPAMPMSAARWGDRTTRPR